MASGDSVTELKEVKQELKDIEYQIEALLERQQVLRNKQRELEYNLKHAANKQSHDKKWESADFQWSKNLEEKMRTRFKLDNLRPMQLQTMNVTMSGKDCILIMPTGGGKSLCFQLPAVVSKGMTLVVSPLVSLMEDQVMALESLGIDAAKLNASCDKQTVNAVHQAMTDKNSSLKMLYVTPEKLAKSKRFMNKLEKMYEMGRFSRLVIDEVHCCSQWGHDFRPDYKFLGIMKRQFPKTPILGLTATATTNVLNDVLKILNIQHSIVFKASFNRPNLYYEVRPKPSASKDVIEEICTLIKTRYNGKSGIIYCFSRKECEETTLALQQKGIPAGCYHADISANGRSQVHKQWLKNKIHIVVATVAFGMGIDKPDVRFVIHHSLSKSMENLYQESGRAGRDDKKSTCIIYYRLADVFRQSTMVFTEQTGVDNLYGIMEYCVDITKCRRSIFAKHFGEVWDQSQCNSMCDHCDSVGEAELTDVTKYCKNIVDIINNASAKDQRLTANKLLESLQGKGPTLLKVRGQTPATIPREKLETILAHMLLKGYLREDYHFTAYSTISYIVLGAKGHSLSDSSTIKLELSRKKKYTDKKQNEVPNSSHDKTLQSSKNPNPKPKLVLVNTEKSLFSPSVGPGGANSQNSVSRDSSQGSSYQGDSNSQSCKNETSAYYVDFSDSDDELFQMCSEAEKCNSNVKNEKNNGVNKIKSTKKKRPLIVSSDSSDDLDFGEDLVPSKPALKKRHTQSSNSCKESPSCNRVETVDLDSD